MIENKQENVNIEATAIARGEIREWDRNGKKGKVATVECESEEHGQLFISLFNEDLDKYDDLTKESRVKIIIKDGFCKHYTPEGGSLMVQVSAGRNGVVEFEKV